MVKRKSFEIMLIPPGVICGCFRRVSATQITRTPTHRTTMVAPTGTIISRSSQAGSQGIRLPDLSLSLELGMVPSELFGPNNDPPIRSKIVKKMRILLRLYLLEILEVVLFDREERK